MQRREIISGYKTHFIPWLIALKEKTLPQLSHRSLPSKRRLCPSPWAPSQASPILGFQCFLTAIIHSFIHSFTHSSTHLSIHPPTDPSIHPSTHSFIPPSIHPPIHIHLPIDPSIHPSIYPFIYPSTHSFTHPPFLVAQMGKNRPAMLESRV